MHFLPFAQFGERKLSHFRPSDLVDWARNAKLRVANGAIGGKTLANVYGLVHTMFGDAVRAELILSNPCVLRGNDLPFKGSAKGRRYELAEMAQLVWNEALPPDVRMLFCLLAFTGERIGEACGHVWSD